MKTKPDLQLRWSKREKDVLVEWNNPAVVQDMSLLFLHMTTDRPKYNSIETMPSLLKELEQRGYDLTTLKFSVSKKKQGDQHGASTVSREDQSGSGQRGNEMDEQGEKTNA